MAKIDTKKIVSKQVGKKIMKVLGYIGAIAAILGIGFFSGRSTVKEKVVTNIEYIPGDTIKIEYPEPEPIYVRIPADTANVIADCIKSGKYYDLFPEKVRDSLIYVDKTDTAAVLRDWATVREYEQQVFDIDTVGTATIKAQTQYNRITWLGASFVPVTKQVTETQLINRHFSPFIGAGVTTFPTAMVQGGAFFEEKYGVTTVYQYDWKLDRHSVGLGVMYKF